VKLTLYIAVIEARELPTDFTNVNWRPWINCDTENELMPRLALHRHIRDRGGVGEGFTAFVCIATAVAEREGYRDPVPASFDCTQFQVKPD